MTGTPTHQAAVLRIARCHVAGATMLAAITAAAGVLVVFWLAGLGSGAVGVAAGSLVVVCLAVCALAAISGGRCGRDIDTAARELVVAQRDQQRKGEP